jgi:hypothetical protein
MARVQLSMEEFLQVIRGEVNLPETREKIAKALMTVWKSEQMQTEIEAHAEHLGKVKMERIIEASFREEKGNWRTNYKPEIGGWAAHVLREEIQKFGVENIIEAIKPEIEAAVGDLVQKQIGAIFLDMMKKQTKE